MRKFQYWRGDFSVKRITSKKRTGSCLELSKQKTAYLKVLIVRGINLRGNLIINDFKYISTNYSFNYLFKEKARFMDVGDLYDNWHSVLYEVFYSAYLILLVGHSEYPAIPASFNSLFKVIKKNRKILLMSTSKANAAELAMGSFLFRPANIFTGRGLRQKGVVAPRKTWGKKDKKKGLFY